MLWLLYGLSLVLVWFENRCIVLPLWDRPLLFQTIGQAPYWLLRLAITYGTLAGLWITQNFKTAAIAFVAYYILNKITFKVHFEREVQKAASRFRNLPPSAHADLLGEKLGGRASPEQEALELARQSVIQNVKGGRF